MCQCECSFILKIQKLKIKKENPKEKEKKGIHDQKSFGYWDVIIGINCPLKEKKHSSRKDPLQPGLHCLMLMMVSQS